MASADSMRTVWAVSPRGDLRVAHAQTPKGTALCRDGVQLSFTVSDDDLSQSRHGLRRCASCVRKLGKAS